MVLKLRLENVSLKNLTEALDLSHRTEINTKLVTNSNVTRFIVAAFCAAAQTIFLPMLDKVKHCVLAKDNTATQVVVGTLYKRPWAVFEL